MRLRLENATLFWSPGRGLRVADGELLPWDHGEWGGGVMWFSPDGSRHRLAADGNTRLLFATKKGIFAFQSLSHLMFHFSRLVRIAREKGAWTSRLVTDLHVDPNAQTQDGDRLVYAAENWISTLETNGTQREIFRDPFGHRFNSLARLRDGTIWSGTAGGLLRLTPLADGTYASAWFVPAAKPRE